MHREEIKQREDTFFINYTLVGEVDKKTLFRQQLIIW